MPAAAAAAAACDHTEAVSPRRLRADLIDARPRTGAVAGGRRAERDMTATVGEERVMVD